jgi:hypothetical protein
MDLVRDYLDAQLLDRRGKAIGRIDGIVIRIEDHRQPRIVAIEVGSVTLARRMSARIGRWVEQLSRRWGKMRPNPYRIDWSELEASGPNYRVDRDAAGMPTLVWEDWLRKHVISRIPGA